LGLAVPFTVLFEYPTLRALAGHLLLLLHSPGAAPIGAQAEQGPSLGDLAAAAAGEAPARLLLAGDAKAAGVPCSPAQLFFVAAHLVRAALMLGQLQGLACHILPVWIFIRAPSRSEKAGGVARGAVTRRLGEGPGISKAGQGARQINCLRGGPCSPSGRALLAQENPFPPLIYPSLRHLAARAGGARRGGLQRAVRPAPARPALRTRAIRRAGARIRAPRRAPHGLVVRVGALPLQVVAPPVAAAAAGALQVVDAAALPAEPAGSGQGLDTLGLSPALVRGLPAAALRRVLADAHAPFDLDAGPLVRALLLRLAPEDHLFVVTVHHAVADGGSLRARARPARSDAQSLGPGVPPQWLM